MSGKARVKITKKGGSKPSDISHKINYDTDEGNIKDKGKEWSDGYPKRKRVNYKIIY